MVDLESDGNNGGGEENEYGFTPADLPPGFIQRGMGKGV